MSSLKKKVECIMYVIHFFFYILPTDNNLKHQRLLYIKRKIQIAIMRILTQICRGLKCQNQVKQAASFKPALQLNLSKFANEVCELMY